MNKANYKPDGFHTVTPYFMVERALQFMEFLKSAFDAQEMFRQESSGRVQHAQMRIGDSMIELAEARREWPAKQFAIHLYVEDADAVYRRAMSAGCKSLGEPIDQPYGERSGAVEDPWGNQWFPATRT